MQHIKTRFWTIHTEKKKKEFSNFPHAPKLRLITMRKWKTDMRAPYTRNEKLIYSPPLYAFFNSDIPMQSRVMREISPWRKKIRERERERENRSGGKRTRRPIFGGFFGRERQEQRRVNESISPRAASLRN